MQELQKLEAPELERLEASKADQIRATFEPMVNMLKEFEADYSTIIEESKAEITAETTKKAKRLRLDIAEVRVATDKVRKEQKEEYLRAGKAIDGVSNILKWAISDKENRLKEIETHFETLEKQRLEALQTERVELLSLYVEDANERQLSAMDTDVWEAYFNSKKKAYEDQKEAERLAELARIEAEKQAAIEAEKERIKQAEIKAENERLKKEAEEKEKQIEAERIEREKQAKAEQLERDRLAKIEADKREAEQRQRDAIAKKEREELQAKLDAERLEREKQAKIEAEKRAAEQFKKDEAARIEREALQAKLNSEKLEREKAELKARQEVEKLAAELKAKQDAEIKAKVDEDARVQAELNKGDADKITDLINDLEALKTKYSFKSDKNKKMLVNVVDLLCKVIAFIQK